MEGIISAFVAGGLALVGVIITNMMGNKKIENQLATAQAVTDTKLDYLTEEVRRHNNFASRMPVVEEQIQTLKSKVENLENKVGHIDDGK